VVLSCPVLSCPVLRSPFPAQCAPLPRPPLLLLLHRAQVTDAAHCPPQKEHGAKEHGAKDALLIIHSFLPDPCARLRLRLPRAPAWPCFAQVTMMPDELITDVVDQVPRPAPPPFPNSFSDQFVGRWRSVGSGRWSGGGRVLFGWWCLGWRHRGVRPDPTPVHHPHPDHLGRSHALALDPGPERAWRGPPRARLPAEGVRHAPVGAGERPAGAMTVTVL